MNIVFVTGLYVPRYSAVGKCVKNLAAEMARRHDVTVLSIKQGDSPLSGFYGDGGGAFRIYCQPNRWYKVNSPGKNACK